MVRAASGRGSDGAGSTGRRGADDRIPTIWLLGRTGAGKTSLVSALTGRDAGEIGSGFAPGTREMRCIDLPPETPVLRFLDTRGLGEAGYDAAADLAEAAEEASVVLAVARLDDPVPGELAAALAALSRHRPPLPVLVVHTGADLVPGGPEARERARSAAQAALEKAHGGRLESVTVALPRRAGGVADEHQPGITALHDWLAERLPPAALRLAHAERRDAEARAFAAVKPLVIRHAGAAGTADVLPFVGAVAVPAVQAAMLRALAQHFGVTWDRKRLAQFAAALGFGWALRFGMGYVLRQGAKIIPVFGQTIGAAAAGSVSFVATWALGRAAAYYLHGVSHGHPPAPEDLRRTYRTALAEARGDTGTTPGQGEGPDGR